jgi:biopolymer transport protein ExbB/TolQ
MEDASILLSDEFIAFAERIKSIHEKKKAKKAELKLVYDKITAELKALDAEASAAEAAFDEWKKSLAKAPAKGE